MTLRRWSVGALERWSSAVAAVLGPEAPMLGRSHSANDSQHTKGGHSQSPISVARGRKGDESSRWTDDGGGYNFDAPAVGEQSNGEYCDVVCLQSVLHQATS